LVQAVIFDLTLDAIRSVFETDLDAVTQVIAALRTIATTSATTRWWSACRPTR